MDSAEGEGLMPKTLKNIIDLYVSKLRGIYGSHLIKVVLYGSYARGDFSSDSDVDIMILLDISDLEIKNYQNQLFDMTYDFNVDHDIDIMPIAKSEKQFNKWVKNYPFYANVDREGVALYGAE